MNYTLFAILMIISISFLSVFAWCAMKCIAASNAGRKTSLLYAASAAVSAVGSVVSCAALLEL